MLLELQHTFYMAFLDFSSCYHYSNVMRYDTPFLRHPPLETRHPLRACLPLSASSVCFSCLHRHSALPLSLLKYLLISSINRVLVPMSIIETDGLSVTYSSDRTGAPDLRLIHFNDVYHVEYALVFLPLLSLSLTRTEMLWQEALLN